jgi:hypothetical protein
MPFQKYDPERGYYEALSWRQVIAIAIVAACIIAAIVVYLVFLRPPGYSDEQEAILENVNCLRALNGYPVLKSDRRLMRRAQELADLFLEEGEWKAMGEVEAQGAGVVWSKPGTDLSEADPCLRRWFVPLDAEAPSHPPVEDPELTRVGFGYVLRSGDATGGSDEEIVVFLVR